MAPMTRVPSSPRLMRPLFSVRHSPRLTKIKGGPARIAPLSTASGTPNQPNGMTSSMLDRCSSKHRKAPVQRLADQDHQEDDSLHHQHGSIGQIVCTLNEAAARVDSAKQNCGRNNRERILPRDEGDQYSGIS